MSWPSITTPNPSLLKQDWYLLDKDHYYACQDSVSYADTYFYMMTFGEKKKNPFFFHCRTGLGTVHTILGIRTRIPNP